MPSATTLKALEKDMKTLAAKNAATNIRIASQFDFISSFGPGLEKGVCHGLSMMYLAYFRSKMNGSFFDDVNKNTLAGSDKGAPYVPYVTKAHFYQKGHGDSDAEGEEKQRTMMSGFGMSFKEKQTFGGGWGHGHTSLGKFVGKKPYYYLIKIPGHKMAAYPSGDSYRFYDPNMGEVTFGSATNLGKFLSDYFRSPIMQGAFAKNGAKVSAIAYRFTA